MTLEGLGVESCDRLFGIRRTRRWGRVSKDNVRLMPAVVESVTRATSRTLLTHCVRCSKQLRRCESLEQRSLVPQTMTHMQVCGLQ